MAQDGPARAGYDASARAARREWRRGTALAGLLSLIVPLGSARAETAEQQFDVSVGAGSGIMRGGRGGLALAQRAPIFVAVGLLTPHEPWLLLGGSLHMELEAGQAIAIVPRAALRHKLSALELRPGLAIPFYFAPKTMLGAEANLGVRMPFGSDFGFVANAAISAFMVGNDVPDGTTVIMFQLMLGVDLFL